MKKEFAAKAANRKCKCDNTGTSVAVQGNGSLVPITTGSRPLYL